MLLLRDVQKSDLPGLKRLAAVLNTVNLPNDEEVLERADRQVGAQLRRASIKDPFEREYLFVLEDARNGTHHRHLA